MITGTDIFVLADRQIVDLVRQVVRDNRLPSVVKSGSYVGGTQSRVMQLLFADSVTQRDLKQTLSAIPESCEAIWITGEMLTADSLRLLAEHPVQLVCGPCSYEDIHRVIAEALAKNGNAETKLELDLVFRSSAIAGTKLVFPLADWLFKRGLIDNQECRSLHLAFQEAVTNSLEHGNLELKSEWKEELDDQGIDLYSKKRKERLAQAAYGQRLIKVEACFDGKQLSLAVEDEGAGFDFDQILGRPPALEASFGRGFSLISAFMDRVSFNEKGTKIFLSKQIG